MCYERLHFLSPLLDNEKIDMLGQLLSEYSQKPFSIITVNAISSTLDVYPDKAIEIMMELEKNDLVFRNYAVRCPECGTLIKKAEKLSDLLDEENCYSCENNFEVTEEDIELLFYVKNPDFFDEGQHEKEGGDSCSAALASKMKIFIESGGINQLLFHPTVDEYNELQALYKNVFKKKKTSKSKGDTLEQFIIYLFGLCEAFNANGIHLSTNQIDCFVANKFLCSCGIFAQVGSRIVIECKNEEKTPSGTYMSKIDSIISNANAGNTANFVKLGIIVSKEKPPKTYKELAVKYYLSKRVVVISLWKQDLYDLVEEKKNLMEMLDRKITEIVMDSTTDLVKAGLYTA